MLWACMIAQQEAILALFLQFSPRILVCFYSVTLPDGKSEFGSNEELANAPGESCQVGTRTTYPIVPSTLQNVL